MPSVILTNWTVYYSDDTTGNQQLRWTGTTGTNTVNELYSAIQDLFDETAQLNDSIPISGQTPSEYTIGLIEAGETNGWFIDAESIKHLTGGSIQTASWNRVTGTNIGIVKATYTTGTQFVDSDIGKPVTHTDGDDGVLLYFDASLNECWIRPDTSAAADDWNSSSGTIAVTGGTGSVTQSAAATSGEMIWSNIFTLGTFVANTRLYLTQSNTQIVNAESSGSGTWWGDGQIDVLILTTDQDTLIDNGFLTIYARQYSKTLDFVVVDLSGGGSTPIPLATVDDPNNDSGIRTVTVSSATGAFSVGEIVTGGTSGAKGIVTENTGSPTTSFEYYLVADVTIDFTNTETLTGSIVGSNGTAGTPAGAGPSAFNDVTYTFGNINTFDIDADLTQENYSIVVDCNNRPLSDVYERMKHDTRRGETGTSIDIVSLLDSYNESNQDDVTPLDQNSLTEAGQSFTGNGDKLYSIIAYIRRIGTSTNQEVAANLYAHTGTFGSTGTPTGAAIAQSNAYNHTDISTSLSLVEFRFTTQPTLTNATNYFITLENPDGDTSDYIDVGTDTSTPSHAGNFATWNDISWTAVAGTDMIFYVKTVSTSTTEVDGEQYIGVDYRLDYNALTGTIDTGDTVTQLTSLASSFVVAHDTVNKVLMLRDTFGTYNTTNNVEVDGSNFVTMTSGSTEVITPVKNSPFASFAGGRMFTSRGVVLDNVPTADANNYEVITNGGVVKAEPIQVTFVISNIETDTEVRIYNNDTKIEVSGTEGTFSQLDSVINIADGGTGYTVSDVLTVLGGTRSQPAQLTVTSVDGGVITGVSISNAGTNYSVNPTDPASVSGGTGAGATFNLSFKGTFTHAYTYVSDIPVFVVVFHLNFKDIRLVNQTLTNTNQNIPVQQIPDRNYLNPA